MVDVPRVRLPRLRASSERRRRRLERELRALYAMRGHLTTRDVVWAVVSILGVAVLCLLVALKLHWLVGSSLPVAIAGAFAAGVVVWLIGWRSLTLAWCIVIALVIIVFEDVPTLDWGTSSTDEKKDRKEARKEDRRRKLERAIARREALLSGLHDERAAP